MTDFLDRLKKGLDKSVTAVTVKSKELLETTQLRAQLGGLKDQKRAALEELGNIVYTLTSQQGLDAARERVASKCGEVALLDEQMKNIEADIRRIQAEAAAALGVTPATGGASCRACGTSNVKTAKFCARCGQQLAATPS